MNPLLRRFDTRRFFVNRYVSHLTRSAVKNELTTRLTAIILLTALLMPILFVGNFVPVAASTRTSVPNAPVAFSAPNLAPPAPFDKSSDSASVSFSKAALSTIVSVNQSLTSGYRFLSDAVNPHPPDGLALAKMPTVSERVAASLSSSAASAYSSVSSVVTPLFAVPTNNSSVSSANVEPPAPLPPPPGINKFDFDGDGIPEAARWQPSSGEWRYKKSSDNSLVSVALGAATSAVPADYDGDGKTDITRWSGRKNRSRTRWFSMPITPTSRRDSASVFRPSSRRITTA